MSSILLLLASSPALAAEDYVAGTLEVSANCTFELTEVEPNPTASSELRIIFRDAGGGIVAPPSCEILVDKQLVSQTTLKGVRAASVIETRKAGTTDIVQSGIAPEDDEEGKPAAKRKLAELTVDAESYVAANSAAIATDTPGDHVVVVLPDGTSLDPLPEDVDEDETVQVVVIYPQGGTPPTIKGVCAARTNVNTVYGSITEATGVIGTQRFVPGEPAPISLLHRSETFQCADKLTVTTSIEHPSFESAAVSLEVTIQDLHRFSWGAVYGFDFGERTSGLALKELTETADDGTETTTKVLGGETGLGGPRGFVAVNVHLAPFNPQAGTKYLAERPWSALALTVAVDPAALKSGFVGGVSLFPVPGLGVLAGASAFTTQVAEGGDLRIDDTWTGTSDPTISDAWRRDSVGFFLGVNVTGALLKSLGASTE